MGGNVLRAQRIQQGETLFVRHFVRLTSLRESAIAGRLMEMYLGTQTL